jgi:HEAT repeat protein
VFFDSIARILEIEETNREDSRNYIDDGLRLLGAVRSPRAVELLKKYTNDRDWVIRNQAIELLKAIKDGSDLPGYEDY